MSGNKSVLVISTKNHSRKEKADFVCLGNNDQDPINEAIRSLPAEGGEITLLAGTYSITKPLEPIRNNLTISGIARDAVVIRASRDLQAGIIQDLTPTLESPRIGLTIRDLTLDGSLMKKDGNVFNKGIYIVYLRRALIENVNVYNTGSTGIGVDFLFDSVIRNNIVEKCGFPAAETGNAGIGIGTGGSKDEPLVITGNHVSGCGLAGIMLEVQHPNSGAFLNHIVANNVIRQNHQFGILMRGLRRTLISTNIVISNWKDGIRLDTYKEMAAADVLIGNNIVQDNAGYGINIDSVEADNIQVFNNNVKRNGAGGMTSRAKPGEVSRFDNVGDDNNLILGNLTVAGKEIYVRDLPTSDPRNPGQVWNDQGTLKLSSG